MLARRRLTEPHECSELAGVPLAFGTQADKLAPGRMGECDERGVDGFGRHADTVYRES